MVISSPEPLGSQGELILFALSQRRPSSVRRPPFSNILSSEAAWPIKANFYVELPWEGGGGDESLYKSARYHDQDGRHANISLKALKIFFSATRIPMILKLGILHWDSSSTKFI